jgi:hypothetical protein
VKLTPRLAGAAVGLLFALIVAGSAFAIWQARVSVANADRQWCSTLTLLTARPVPRPSDASANPSREDAYVFYRNLVTLRDRFGC